MRKDIKDLFYFGILSTITMTLGLGAFVLVVKIMQPLKVAVEPDQEQLQTACVVGYLGNAIKVVTVDLIVDAHVYCKESLK